MTDRERWTVYPLLFLALGISLKDKLSRSVDTDRIECKTLVCEELVVAGPEPDKRVLITQGNVIAKGGVLSSALEVSGPKPGQRVVITEGNVAAKGSIVSENLEVTGPNPGQRVAITQGSILCRTLIASDETGQKQLAVVSSNQDGGILRTFGTHTGTHAVLGNFNQYAGLLFVDARGAAHAGPMYGSPVPLKKPEETGPEQTAPEQAGAEQNGADKAEPNGADKGAAEQPSGEQAPPPTNSPESTQENKPAKAEATAETPAAQP